jgi:hypothetical protein
MVQTASRPQIAPTHPSASLSHSIGPRALATRLLAASLIPLLVPATPLFAQAAASHTIAGPQAPGIQTSAPTMLHITILEGEDALNNIRERTAREPIVQIEDQNHKPVAGVAVVFTSLRGTNGAGGTFNDFTSFKTVTNAQGRAIGRGFKPNTVTGQFSVQVQAMAGTLSATTVIHEINSTTGGEVSSSSTAGNSTTTTTTASQTGTTAATGAGHLLHLINLIPKWVVVGVVAGGATAAAVATTTPSNGATISTGTGVVTAPAATKAPTRR